MKIEIKIDPLCEEDKIILITKSVSEEINEIVEKLSQSTPRIISGFRGGKTEILEQEDLIRIYSGSGKVFGVTSNGEYTLRLRLYQLEGILNPSVFVRISNSEIINLKKAESFDLSLSGTIRVALSNGDHTYVSRRYVSKIKQLLGV